MSVHGPWLTVVTLTYAVEDSPDGFPLVATYLDSDDLFMIYRRFGTLHARLLLNKQDELRELEEDLHDMDEQDAKDEDTDIYLMSRTKDNKRQPIEGRRSRKELLEIIEKKTLEYGMCNGPQTQSYCGLTLRRSTTYTSAAACSFKQTGRSRSSKCIEFL